MGKRSIWKGALSFGLVNIPIQMYTASREKELSFVLLHKKDLSEVRYARVCKAEEKEIPWNEIVKGYEYEEGEFVVLEEKDFEKASPKRTKSIEVLHFVNESEVDPLYYVKPYYLEPDKNSNSAYALLREALAKSKKVGLVKYVLRNREHLGLLKVYDKMLALIELRYFQELVKPDELELPAKTSIGTKEMGMALQLIEHLTVPFNPKQYQDTYADEIKKIIKQKAKGKPIRPKREQPKSSKIHDMMDLLKESLNKAKKTSKKASKTA